MQLLLGIKLVIWTRKMRSHYCWFEILFGLAHRSVKEKNTAAPPVHH